MPPTVPPDAPSSDPPATQSAQLADASPGEPPSPVTGPVKVDIVSVSDLPAPKKDMAWWITTAGSVFIGGLALIVAFVSLVFQHQSNAAAQSSATRADASLVSIIQEQGSSTFEIENRAQKPIYSVFLYPVAHDPENMGTLGPCTISSVLLTSTDKPVIYFKDASGVSWERTISGQLLQAVNPSSLAALAPPGIAAALSRHIAFTTTPAPSCSS